MFRIVLFLALVVPAVARAQSRSLVAPEAARQFGLERMWFTQMGLDRGRGGMAGLTIHVSPTQAHTVFQFTDDGKRQVFSERDRDAFGKEIGVDVAKAQADKQAEAIKTARQAAGQADAVAPAVETFVVPKITLYAASQRGSVTAIDGETGRPLWSVGVGNPLYPTTAPGANDKYVAVCNGSTLYVLLATDGSVVWSRPAVNSPGAGPALTSDHVFVPMVNGQVQSFVLDDPTQPTGMFRSFGRTMVQPAVSSHTIAWPTDSGNLYLGDPSSAAVRFRVKASEAIMAAPAFLEPDKVFFTSIDGYLYCVSETRGNMLWRFTTGEPISHSPVALGDTVYVITDRGTMYALDAATSSERWIISGVRSYLAGNDKRLYCQDTRGNLVVLDAASGRRIGSFPLGPTMIPVLNSQTDRIFVVSPTGMVQCLRESGLPWPVVHYQIEPERKVVKLQGKAQPTKKEEKPAATGDPFGGADPFGSSSGARPPAPPAAAGDPFGAPPAARPATPPAAADPFATP